MGSAAVGVPTVKLSSGWDMPMIGLGTSGVTGQTCTQAVEHAIKLGLRHIDTAQNYGNEQDVGKAVHAALASGVDRAELFIATKLANDKHDPEVVESTVHESLRKLQCRHIDLLYVHWPFAPEIEPETWQAVEALVDAGLIRSVGISNFSPEKVDRWFANAKIQPAVNQHPLWRNDRIVKHHERRGIHVVAYAPIGSPATMSNRGRKVPNLIEDENVQRIAKKLGKTPAQVLLRWGLQHGTTVIPRSKSEQHQKEILEVANYELPDEDFKTLSGIESQLKFFPGLNFAIGEGSKYPYHSYQDLWDEEPTQAQKEQDNI